MNGRNIQLREEDFRYVEQKAKQEGLSVSEAMERLVAFLRRVEQRPVHPDVISLMGILRGIDPDEAQSSYITAKHM